MKYEESLINITDKLCESNTMYSLILLDAKSLNLTLSGYRCFLDGKYIVCLNVDDTLSIHSGYYQALNLRFQPYFYNINLNHEVIGMIFYDEMREKYGYPDFRLFRVRDNGYFGIISVSDEEYNNASLYFAQAKRDIESSSVDIMWSCRARSDIISVLHIAEGAYLGKQSGLENEILRYIHDNINEKITLDDLCTRFNTNRTTVSEIIKEKTGLPPIKYVLEVRLNQSRPDLLFTKLPINEISEKYGFSDVNYYIRAFKKRFGKSPLQFRKDGWEERIRNEGIYQRRAEMEKTSMTVKEFKDYCEKGLGRAIIRLKKQEDKEPFKQVFLEYLFGEKREFHRRLDVYEKEIIDVFDDDALKNEITTRLTEGLSKDEKVYIASIPLLVLLGYREKAEEILENRYKESYAQLLEYTKKPWDGEKYPPFAKVYMNTAIALGKYLKLGDERIKQILFDIADLYDYCDSPVIPTYQNPIFGIWDGVGTKHFIPILEEAIKEHRNGESIDIRRDNRIVPLGTTFPAPSLEDILKYDDITRANWDLVEGFKNADEETVKAVAAAALAEKDIAKKIYLLNYFTITTSPEDFPVEFPLDVEPLIKMAEEENFQLPNEPPFGITLTVLEILENKRCKSAHELAMKLFYDNSCSKPLWRKACGIRFGKNYIPETDRADFVALLRTQNPHDLSMAMYIFRRDVRAGVKDLPLDMIPYVFANITPDWSRYDFCKTLVEQNLMPEDLKAECLYDSNRKIRELFLKK